jgi:hypothetical protein
MGKTVKPIRMNDVNVDSLALHETELDYNNRHEKLIFQTPNLRIVQVSVIEQKYLAIYVEAIDDDNSMFDGIHKIERRVVDLIKSSKLNVGKRSFKSLIRKTGNIVRFRFVIPVESGDIVVDEKLNVITSKKIKEKKLSKYIITIKGIDIEPEVVQLKIEINRVMIKPAPPEKLEYVFVDSDNEEQPNIQFLKTEVANPSVETDDSDDDIDKVFG